MSRQEFRKEQEQENSQYQTADSPWAAFLPPSYTVVPTETPSSDSKIEILLDTIDSPPQNAQYLLCLVLKRADREVVIGDLEQEFREINRRFGLRKARLWYWTQVLRSLWPFIAKVLKCLCTLATARHIGQWLQRLSF